MPGTLWKPVSTQKTEDVSSPAGADQAPRIPPRPATRDRAGDIAPEREIQVVTFVLGDEEYAVDILQVQEIVMMTPITRMPRAPRFVEGIVNLRGQMIPIIDMRTRLSLPAAARTVDTRIIVTNVGGEVIGMIVDGVRQVMRLPESAITPPPAIVKGISADYLTGIGTSGDRLLIMLDLDKVLSADEQQAIRAMDDDE